MLYTDFKEIPFGILEAVRMDGAGLWQELAYVLAPMAVPGIASTLLLNVILSWNEAFCTLNLTNKYAAPLSFFISEYSSPEGQFWAKLSAASLMADRPDHVSRPVLATPARTRSHLRRGQEQEHELNEWRQGPPPPSSMTLAAPVRRNAATRSRWL